MLTLASAVNTAGRSRRRKEREGEALLRGTILPTGDHLLLHRGDVEGVLCRQAGLALCAVEAMPAVRRTARCICRTGRGCGGMNHGGRDISRPAAMSG
ncbi:MAG TPA: hypothetical protein DD444_07640 [Citreicella sp.]|nr:hypothetical protein [Citreicella sp.]